MLSKTDRESGVCDRSFIAKYRVCRRRDGTLDLWRRQAPTASRRIRRYFDKVARYVVPIPSVALDRVTGCQALAALVEQLARERTWGRFPCLRCTPNSVASQQQLRPVP